jgi:hypothetical protein
MIARLPGEEWRAKSDRRRRRWRVVADAMAGVLAVAALDLLVDAFRWPTPRCGRSSDAARSHRSAIRGVTGAATTTTCRRASKPWRSLCARSRRGSIRHDGCRRPGREGRTVDRHRGRQQPPGAADRAGGRRRPLRPARHGCDAVRQPAASFRARWAVPTIVWRRANRRDCDRTSQTGRRCSTRRGDLPMTCRILPVP